MRSICSFLILAALIAGMVGCAPTSYALVISSTEGGSVTDPGEGIFIYDYGTVVNLTVEAVGCYRFTNWTGDVSRVADVNAATTNITIKRSYFVTANFANFGVETVYFADPNLEAAVRKATAGSICAPILERLPALAAINRNIADLTGLEHCTNLRWLNLVKNRIGNVTALTNLTSLSWLNLDENQISDLSPLANLTSLEFLSLRYNQISDISLLTTFAYLTWLDLNRNQISDISFLVQNEGLDAGDVIYLEWNPLSSDSINIYVPQLQARGVTVHY